MNCFLQNLILDLILLVSLLVLVDGRSLRGSLKDQPLFQNELMQLVQDAGFSTCYGVMFDAGSSGTRVYVYNWPCREIQTITQINVKQMAPQEKNKPGIATFAKNLGGIQTHLKPLIDYAKNYVPNDQLAYTPIMLGATAGMRMLVQEQQVAIMNEIRVLFQQSGFLFLDPEWARVISGQEEGSYMWLSVNYLLQLIDPKVTPDKTALTIDLGGASTQIAFKPASKPTNSSQDAELVIPNFNDYDIYSISYLGYGNDMARNHIIGQSQLEGSKVINTPCYHKGYTTQWDVDPSYQIIGTGDQVACQNLISRLLNNEDDDCEFPETQCSINHTFEPKIDLTANLYGLNGITTAATFLGLTSFTLTQFQTLSSNFCQLTWDEVQQNPLWRDDPFVPSDYFLLQYTYSLLKVGYRVPNDKVINAPLSIQNNSPSWTLAGMFYQVAQIECQFDSPICNTLQFQGSLFDNIVKFGKQG